MSVGEIYGLVTLLVMSVFITATVWAWSSGRRRTYEAAARLPLEDNEPTRGLGKLS